MGTFEGSKLCSSRNTVARRAWPTSASSHHTIERMDVVFDWGVPVSSSQKTGWCVTTMRALYASERPWLGSRPTLVHAPALRVPTRTCEYGPSSVHRRSRVPVWSSKVSWRSCLTAPETVSGRIAIVTVPSWAFAAHSIRFESGRIPGPSTPSSIAVPARRSCSVPSVVRSDTSSSARAAPAGKRSASAATSGRKRARRIRPSG
jgi:hypothetical protein